MGESEGDDDSSGDSTPPICDAFVQQFNCVAGFLRFKKGANSVSGDLQTSVVSYRKSYPSSVLHPSLQVDLVSCIHFADTDYYTTLQNQLASYDCVLFEMLTFKENLESGSHSAALKRMTGFRSRSHIIDIFLLLMAWILRLDHQGACLNYQAENWYHADLDIDTFELLKCGKCERRTHKVRRSSSPLAFHVLCTPLIGLLWASRVLSVPLVGLFIVGSAWSVGFRAKYPELEAFCRLGFGAAVKLYLARQLTSMSTHLMFNGEDESVIIGERNKAAIEALRSALGEGHNRIAILYGAGHMADFGRRLLKEFDLFPARVHWITAWSIKSSASTESSCFRFLRRVARALGWPLNRYQTLALLVFSLDLALQLWLWKLFFGVVVNRYSS